MRGEVTEGWKKTKRGGDNSGHPSTHSSYWRCKYLPLSVNTLHTHTHTHNYALLTHTQTHTHRQ